MDAEVTPTPEVIIDAWGEVGKSYNVNELAGPVKHSFHGRDVRKWATTIENGDDLVSVDLMMLPYSSRGEIPGVQSWDNPHTGQREYYRAGLQAMETRQYGRLEDWELRELHPGTRIRVVVESLEDEKREVVGFKPYKHNQDCVEDLTSAIAKGLEACNISKKE